MFELNKIIPKISSKSTAPSVLVVGLGNMGEEFTQTRHNIGFVILDAFVEAHAGEYVFDARAQADVARITLGARVVLAVRPRTLMNNSGESVIALAKRFEIDSEAIMVIHDDLDISFGEIKQSFAKGTGGNNGVESIVDHLKTNRFWRIRFGIASDKLAQARQSYTKEEKIEAVSRFVLSRFIPDEREQIPELVTQALQLVSTTLERDMR